MAEWSDFFIILAVVCGILTLMTLGAFLNVRKGKKDIDEYLMKVEWMRGHFGTQMPFTYPKVGPDPRDPPRLAAPLKDGI